MQPANTAATYGIPEIAATQSLAERHWYAVQISANHEKKVAAALDRRSVECFLPLYRSVRRWKDRKVELHMPLFPGYAFVHFALQERLRVLQVPGVVRFVGFSTGATPVPEIQIEQIKDILNHTFYPEPYPYFTSRRRVRVKSGPLRDMEGVIVRRKNRSRFVVSFELIQRSVVVEVGGLELEPIPNGFSRNEFISLNA
jgi:transcription termination/antitermination protein NusG